MANIGDTYRTGELAPVDGRYDFVKHIDPTGCAPTPDERSIAMRKGNPLPPHRSCSKGVIWSLAVKH